MKAITVWAPFSNAIQLADPRELGPEIAKTLELRNWKPPVDFIGEEFAIHSAKRDFDEADAEEVGRLLFEKLPDHLVAKYLPMTRGQWFHRLREGMGRILCIARLGGVAYQKSDLPLHQRRWWVKNFDFAWKLENVRSLPRPILCRGQQGLWDIPEGELAELRMQIPEAAR